MEKLNLSSPWITYVHEIMALFEQDPDIRIVFDNEACEVKLFVENYQKADALSQILPVEKEFGNITLKITVVPSNNDTDDSPFSIICKAFDGNPVFSYGRSVRSVLGSFNYAVFKNEVVQFFNDQLDDIYGNKSTLYQDIAKDVIGNKEGVFYCTDTPDNVIGAPLGEWP